MTGWTLGVRVTEVTSIIMCMLVNLLASILIKLTPELSRVNCPRSNSMFDGVAVLAALASNVAELLLDPSAVKLNKNKII